MIRRAVGFFLFYQNDRHVGLTEKSDMTRFYVAYVGGLAVFQISISLFIPAFAIFIGASDTLTSIMSSMGVYSFLPMFLSPLVYEKLARRRRAIGNMQWMTYMLLCGCVLIPLFWTGNTAGAILLVVTIFGVALFGMTNAGMNVWVMEIVKPPLRAQYFARRELLAKLFICLFAFLLGSILEYFNNGYAGFVVIYVATFAFGMMQYTQTRKISDTRYELSPTKMRLSDLIRIPFQNRAYLRITGIIAFFFFVAWLSYSFRSVYMLRYLNISYVLFSFLFSFRMIIQGVSCPFWGKLAQKKGWYTVFVLCVAFFSLEYVSWMFTTGASIGMLFVAHIASGIANGGLMLSTLNLRFESMPTTQRTIYEGFYNLILGIGCVIGPIIANLIRVRLPELSGTFFPNSQMQIMFFVSFVINTSLLAFLSIKKRKTLEAIKGKTA